VIECGVGKLFDELMGFTIEDAIALLDGGLADRLSQMTLARARRTEE
jgi:hypothetical protein